MPFLTDKPKVNTNELSLSINGTICRDQHVVSNHLCEYFATVADGIVDTSAVDDKVLATHPSVQNIRQKMTGYQGFQFQNLQSFQVEKALQNLNVRKSNGRDGIPPMALKLGATELTNPLTF